MTTESTGGHGPPQHYADLCTRLERLFRHEIRGLLGAAVLQFEVLSLARRKSDSDREGRALRSVGEGLDAVVSWTERRDRWIAASAGSLGELGPSSQAELLDDIGAILRTMARRLPIAVEVDLGDLEGHGALAEPTAADTRVALLAFCTALAESLSEANRGNGSERATLSLSELEAGRERSTLLFSWPETLDDAVHRLRSSLVDGPDRALAFHWEANGVRVGWATRPDRF